MKDRLMRVGIRAALASDWAVRVLARKRDDSALDPQVAAVLALMRITKLPALDSLEPRKARRLVDSDSPLELDPLPMAEVIDLRAGDVPVRVFVPERASGDWIVYFHGGGGVVGSIKSAERVTRYLAERTRCTIASVDYRLGPEHRHPAAIDDANAAWAAIVARAPKGARIAVAGDSFGGYLSAHVDRNARRTGGRRPDAQALIYPMFDLTLASASIDRYRAGLLLTKSMLQWFVDHYLSQSADRRSASPRFWPDSDVRGAAPALVVTAGFDPLVDEGDAWAERLRGAGVTVRHQREPALIHSFLALAGTVRAARAAADRMCADLVEMMRS
jgi:acetyl esterase